MYPQSPQITPNTFLHTPSTPKPSTPPTTIFFISGNPGLVGYYHTFLSLLSSTLAPPREDGPPFQIYSRSLAGFEVGDAPPVGTGCVDLEEQIRYVQSGLEEFVARDDKAYGDAEGQRRKVILIGHSVGAYIAMEILRRDREKRVSVAPDASGFDIVGGVMLFPTVVDIAKSPAGVKLTVSTSIAAVSPCEGWILTPTTAPPVAHPASCAYSELPGYGCHHAHPGYRPAVPGQGGDERAAGRRGGYHGCVSEK